MLHPRRPHPMHWGGQGVRLLSECLRHLTHSCTCAAGDQVQRLRLLWAGLTAPRPAGPVAMPWPGAQTQLLSLHCAPQTETGQRHHQQ